MKLTRYLLYIFIGGLIGGLIGILVGFTNGFRFIAEMSLDSKTTIETIGIIGILVTMTLIIFSLYMQKKALKYKKQLERHIEESDADSMETKASLSFMNVSLMIYLSYVVTFVLLLIYVVGNVNERFTLYPTVTFVMTSLSFIPYGFFIRKYDSRFPKSGEKNYTEKTLAMMDEGERHITLVSMFKIYHMNLNLLIIGILLLGIFSIESGVNQTVGLMILIILFVYNVFGYLLKVRKYYR